MSVIVKFLRNTELTATIKIKSDSGGGSATITKEMLCYKPEDQTLNVVQDKEHKFQDVTDDCDFNILNMQWAGYNSSGSGRLYRGSTDLEHEIMAFCVGDTCQMDLEGQENAPESEYNKEDLIVELSGEMTIYIRIRKHHFASYSGELATYGQYEDENVRGPRLKQ